MIRKQLEYYFVPIYNNKNTMMNPFFADIYIDQGKMNCDQHETKNVDFSN